MTAHSSRLPLRLAPLIAEAKQRMRRRRSLVVLLIVLAGLAVGLTFIFRSSAPGPGVPRPLSASVRYGDLRISRPEGFHRYTIRGGGMVGTRPLVIGYVLTDFRLPAKAKAEHLWTQWSRSGGSGPPANRVALMLEPGEYLAPVSLLQLPITVNQRGFDEEKLDNGAIGYRWGFFRFHAADYEVMYWSGPAAPANDRAALLQALKSIRPARRP